MSALSAIDANGLADLGKELLASAVAVLVGAAIGLAPFILTGAPA